MQEYITITHINDFYGFEYFRPGMILTLRKDHDNPYDDEAVTVFMNEVKCGYVANSVATVCRGTHSAGFLQHLFNERMECIARFISEDFIIAELKLSTEEGKG